MKNNKYAIIYPGDTMTINEEYKILITGYTSDGHGVGRLDNFVVFVPGVIKGEEGLIKINTIKKNYATGSLVKLIKQSDKRIESKCIYSSECGGCSYQHLLYSEELEIKQETVINAFKKIAGVNIELDNIIKSPLENYRNKITYKTNESNNELSFGYYKENSNNFINIDKCIINTQLSNRVITKLRELLKKENQNIKELIIRSSNKENQIVIYLKCRNDLNSSFIELLTKEFPEIKGIVIKVNDEDKTIYGTNYIEDKIGSISYKININSFFQVNRFLTETLYQTAILNFLKKTDILLDAYCGSGAISLYAADKVKKVYGIEINKSSINDAIENAKLNKITNTEFILGDVTLKIKEIPEKIDALIVDPPRNGLDKKFINIITNKKIEKIIYISCNPSTLARDVKIFLEKGYEIKVVKAIDMFPRTKHVETICKLKLKTK